MNQEITTIQTTKNLSEDAKANILQWLTEEKYTHYVDELVQVVREEEWKLLEDNFFRVLPFGTGGRRGTVGIGSNRVNRVTVGETVQALCDYLKQLHADHEIKGVAVAYDSRLTSKEFSGYCTEVLAGNNIKAYIFDGPRSTPELSFAVRHLDLNAGIVITASHNPCSDNGIKLYWEDGGQLVQPHDTKILETAKNTSLIATQEYESAINEHKITVIGQEIDDEYYKAVLSESRSNERNLRIAYSPLHGTGLTSVYPVLVKAGYDVLLYEAQATLDGNFTNVTNNIPNPEVPAANDKVSDYALENVADIAITNDPDADRYCVIVKDDGVMTQLSGNQAAILMTDYILEKAKKANLLTERHFIASTIVTTDMLLALARQYNIKSVSDLLVGFKYIGEQVHLRCDKGDEIFICGGEESYGGAVGTYARDKDGAAPSLMIAELAAELKKQNKTLITKLDELYRKHGYYLEDLESIYFYGAQGSEIMKSFMHHIRSNPLTEIGGSRVLRIRDYIGAEEIPGKTEDVLRIELSEDGRNRITIRPSGTEPKLKMYIQLYSEVGADLDTVKSLVKKDSLQIRENIKSIVESFSKNSEKL